MPIPFVTRIASIRRQPAQFALRPLGNKLQEIAERAPEKIAAFTVLADYTLAELNAGDREPVS